MASPDEGILVSAMRLKVLYTFDVEHKNNHLARYPQSLDVQTAFIDDTTRIGIIDLKTCLEAVTEASPELLPGADNDFTIYAYDYSEPDTPLVGQGLLSRQAEALEAGNENMITGRITKNIMGVFGKGGAQETLEVKLRFNPVAAANQRQRSGSLSGSDGPQQSWTGASQMQLQAPPRSASPMDTTGLEAMQRMLSEGGQPRDRSGSFVGGDPFYARPGSRPSSRAGTPTLAQPFNPPMRQPGAPISRPGSRASMHPVSHARRDSFNSGYYSGEDNVEEGPSRKRAKITKVNQPSRSDLNIERQPDSLRVAASTASSVRIHRPVPINPALALETAQSAEEPVRPPTPIPTKTGRPRGRPRKNGSSNLNRGSRARQSSPAMDPVNRPSDVLDVSMSSPEDTRQVSASSTPANIPSSPPVLPDHQPTQSSPRLPPLLGDHDSGFMSSNYEDIFGNDAMLQFEDFINDEPNQTIENAENQDGQNDNQVPALATYAPVFEDGNEIEAGQKANEAPTEIPAAAAGPFAIPRPLSRSQSSLPIPQVSMSSPRMTPMARARQFEEERRASMLSQVPASDPPARSNFHRSNTWAGDMSDMPTSDAPTAEEQKSRTGSRKRVGKEQTRARLENAIASGEMPPFCDNCGAIETPAWRRAYRKDFECPWEEVETSLEDGVCNYKEPTDFHADGTVKGFKGYKLSKGDADKDWDWRAISLCNPCGLWFHKQKCMRPPEKWQKRDPQEKRKRRSRKKTQTAGPKKASGAGATRSDAPTPTSDGSSPADTATEAADADDRDNVEDGAGNDNEPELPPMPRLVRANSADPGTSGGAFGIGLTRKTMLSSRVTRSSPLRPHGSEKQPIEIDMTPKPLRRQLFPSPDKPASKSDPPPNTATEPNCLPAFVRRSPRLNKIKDVFGQSDATIAVLDPDHTVAKDMSQDDLDDLFDHGNDDFQLPPTTPTPKRRIDHVFKTPGRTPGRVFGDSLSPNVQRTPKSVLGQGNVAAMILGLNKTPARMTPFTRSIHDALREAASSTVIEAEETELPAHNAPGSAMKNFPFDFPDLPSLNGSSPMSHNPMFQFDLSELTTEHLHTDYNDVFSTDAPMPSSPPAGFMNFGNSRADTMDGLWKDGIPFDDQPEYMKLSPIRASEPVLRRSPRKQV